jgi:NAD(P)H-dependent flavin oxidoreductase YrpB (nitropropane dioxygenase family)
MMTSDSPVPNGPKAAYTKAQTSDITVTNKIDGIPQRMIVNSKLKQIDRSGPFSRWKRGIDAGLAMKKQAGASWSDLIKTARSMTAHGEMSLPDAMMAAAAPMLLKRAVVDGDAEGGLMATGLVAGRLTELPSCAELLARIEREARARFSVLAA